MLESKGAILLGKLTDVREGTLEFDARVNDYVKFGDDASIDFKSAVDSLVEKTGREAPPPEVDPLDLPDSRAGERELIRELDLDAAGIATVIWAVGFTHDFAWLDLPIFDDQNHPVHARGVTKAPGVYFVGLHCLHTLSSGLIYGVGRDAEHIADQINEHLIQIT